MTATMRTVLTIWLTLSLAFVLNGCDKKSGSDSSPESSTPHSASHDATQSRVVSDPSMIARTGSMSLGSPNPEETVDKITKIVNGLGGYVSNQSTYHASHHAANSDITVRIPVVRFDTALGLIRRSAKEVLSEDINAEDRAMDYNDVSTRLAEKQAEQKKLDTLSSSAKRVKDKVAVEGQRRDQQDEMDKLSDKARNIQRDVRYSTLRISISSEGEQGFFERIGMAIEGGFSSFADVFAGTVQFLIGGFPAIAALFGFIYLLIWLSKRSGRRRREFEEPPE